jgi:hypothetical protein
MAMDNVFFFLVLQKKKKSFLPCVFSSTQPTRGWNRVGLKKKQEKKKPDVTRQVDPARPG